MNLDIRRGSRWPAALALIALVTLFALPGLVTAAPPGEPITPIEQEVVDLVNAERAKRDLPPLIVNYSLQEAAWSHNEHMADTGCFSHAGCGNGNPGDRIAATGYQAATWGENIAQGQPDPHTVMYDPRWGWMNSPGHRANILGSQYTDIGVAHNSSHLLWTQVFARPSDGYATVTPPAGSGGGEPGVPEPTPTTCVQPMDFTSDQMVDMDDVGVISDAFMAVPGDPRWDPAFDVVPNGVVDVEDIFEVVLHVGDSCS